MRRAAEVKETTMANIALGKQVEEACTNREEATNGVCTGYGGMTGFAELTWPAYLTIDLERATDVRCIRILLWDGLGKPKENAARDSRRYKYRLLVSSDHNTWRVIFDSGETGYNGWQVFLFQPPVACRFIRMHGLSNTANAWFQVVQVEVHDVVPEPVDAEVVLERTIRADGVESEVGDGLPLTQRMNVLRGQIERLVESTQVLNPEPFNEIGNQLRNHVREVASLESSIDGIRKMIVIPVLERLREAESVGRFSIWGFWVGLIGSVMGISSLALTVAMLMWQRTP
jgi:hypothetical protein